MVCNKLKKFKINLQVNIIYGHPDLSKEGSRMKKQRGQMLVEFALLLPLFLLLLFGIMYCGFMYGDYLTLNNMARSAAREAVITIPASGDDTELLAYDALEDRYRETIEDAHMTTNLYTFKDIQIDNTGTSPANGAPPDSIHVRINTVLNKQYAFVNLLTGLGVGIPESYSINYYMYDENGSASDS